MAWTTYQLEALYRNVYDNRLACPGCGGPLALARSDAAKEFGLVTCRACNVSHLVSSHNDPLRNRFRDFTEAEAKTIKAADRARTLLPCPVDGSPMDINAQRSLGLTSNVIVRCRRCSHSVRFVRLHG